MNIYIIDDLQTYTHTVPNQENLPSVVKTTNYYKEKIN